MNKQKANLRWLTETALLLALLVTLQWATKPFGQLVTGSCVNGVLAISTILVGWSGGLCIAILSPFMAFLLQIGPAFFPLTPIIAVGNCLYVAVLAMLYGKGLLRSAAAVAAASVCKAGALYLMVVQGVCRLAALMPPQIKRFTAMFSWPQLVTALIGGALAVALAQLLKRLLKR